MAQKVTRNEAGAQIETETLGKTIKVLIKQGPKIPRVERVCNAPNAHRAEGGEAPKNAQRIKKSSFPLSPLPSKTLKRRRPRHSGFLEPGSVPCVHRVGPVHVPRLEVSLGVRKASLSNAVVLAHDESVVERRQCCLVLLPPQMFGRLRAHGSAAGDQGHRPHFAADGVHPSLASLKYF